MDNSSEIEVILNKARIHCYGLKDIGTVGGKFCRLTFDDMMCWPQTPAGVLAVQSCSNEYIKATKNGVATKQCGADGQWLVLENFTKPWTNYTQCGTFYIEKNIFTDQEIYNRWIPIIIGITQFGYVLSIISLIAALFVFIYIKRLHCARNKLHAHLFASFVMRAVMSLIKYGLFVKGTALPHEIDYKDGEPVFTKANYSWICKAIISLWNYSIISNYMFLLMEGFYLHNLLFLKMFSENRVAVYYYMGWGIPFVFIIPWIILRVTLEDNYCWTQKSNQYVTLLIELPIGFSVIINFVLFSIIMRVLFVKLTSMYVQQRWTKYQKLVRAILILVPLFGIPYAVSYVLSFYVTQNQTFEILWLFFDQTFTAFQGFFASLVYCLMNSDVQVEIARKYRHFKDRNNKELKRRSRTISHTQQIPLTEDIPDFMQGGKEHTHINKTDYF